MNNATRAADCKETGVRGRSPLLRHLCFIITKAEMATQPIPFLVQSVPVLGPQCILAKGR